MADFVANISKGRVVELYNRVDSNDPANSVLVMIPVDVAAVTDATIKDFDTFAAVTAGGVTERNANGWARKTMTDADIVAFSPDDVNDRVDLDIPDQTWTAVTAGNATDVQMHYDNDSTGGTDANLTFLTQHDFAITPDGSDVTAQIAAAGFFRAS